MFELQVNIQWLPKKVFVFLFFVLVTYGLQSCKEKEWTPAILAETAQTDTADYIRLSNKDSITCRHITIELNGKYRGELPELQPGQTRIIPVSQFKDASGHKFPAVNKVKEIILHAESPDGQTGGIQFGETGEE